MLFLLSFILLMWVPRGRGELAAAAASTLHAVLLLELKVLLVQGVDAVNHALHKLDLGVAQTVLVGDVIGVA